MYKNKLILSLIITDLIKNRTNQHNKYIKVLTGSNHISTHIIIN